MTVEIEVEFVAAQPQRGLVKSYRLAVPATVADVLRLAASDPDFSGMDLKHAAVGIFGRLVAITESVAQGDRVEIYRPLAADPKTARRARAREARIRR